MTNILTHPNLLSIHGDITLAYHFGAIRGPVEYGLGGELFTHFDRGVRIGLAPAVAWQWERALTNARLFGPGSIGDVSGIAAHLEDR